MFRYFTLYLYFLRFSFSKAMEFRLDFFFRVVMDCIYYFVNIAFFHIIYQHTQLLGGWNENQVMIFIAIICLTDAIEMTIFNNNFWYLPELVNTGSLDYYLVRPVSSLFFLSLREFAANSFLNLVIAFGIFIYALSLNFTEIQFFDLLYYMLIIALGILPAYCMHLLFLLPVFWSQGNQGLRTAYFVIADIREKPHRIFYGPIRIILLTVLPFSLMCSVPAELIIEGHNWSTLGFLAGMGTVLFAITLFVWKRALRVYSSASS